MLDTLILFDSKRYHFITINNFPMIFPFSLAGKRQRSFCSWAFFGLLTQLALAVVAQTEGWAESEWVQQSFATSPVVSSEDEDVLTGEAAL